MPAFKKPLGVCIGRVLTAVIGVRNEAVLVLLPGGQRHVEGVADKALAHVARKLPADDVPSVHVEYDGQVTFSPARCGCG